MEYYNIIKEIIDKWDPEKLLEQGAPSDEYNSEIITIAQKFDPKMGQTELAKLLEQTFYEAFNLRWITELNPNYLESTQIAQQILNKISEKP